MDQACITGASLIAIGQAPSGHILATPRHEQMRSINQRRVTFAQLSAGLSTFPLAPRSSFNLWLPRSGAANAIANTSAGRPWTPTDSPGRSTPSVPRDLDGCGRGWPIVSGIRIRRLGVRIPPGAHFLPAAQRTTASPPACPSSSGAGSIRSDSTPPTPRIRRRVRCATATPLPRARRRCGDRPCCSTIGAGSPRGEEAIGPTRPLHRRGGGVAGLR